MSSLPVVKSFEFDDFDHFAEFVQQGDIVHQQLSKGHFSGSLEQIAGKHVILSIHRMNQFILQQGKVIDGYITFFIPGDKNQDFTWRCHQLRSNVIGVLHGGMEHHCITHPNFLGMPVSIASGYLLELAQDLGYSDFFKMIAQRECFFIDQVESEFIRSEIDRIFRNPTSLNVFWEEMMVSRLIQVIAERNDEDSGRNSFRTGRTRRKIYQRAVRIMHERVMDPISILDVARAVGVSQRNLRYAFHEVAKMSPKRFFDRLRLNQVRKYLKSGNFRSVIEVSHSYGYWHTGKFASDYKSLFTEFPSDSLNQNLKG